MAFVTAEYLSTADGANFCADYREGKATLNGTWNTYLEKWSELHFDSILFDSKKSQWGKYTFSFHNHIMNKEKFIIFAPANLG